MRVLVFLVVICAIAVSALEPLTEQESLFVFNQWIKQHSKAYHSQSEFDQRYRVFKANAEAVRKHQANPHRTWDMAVNKFADLTSAEFNEIYLGFVPSNASLSSNAVPARLPTAGVASSVDWVAAGKVSPIKDQGQCGSCWAFSTTGAVEADYAIENNASPPSLSEQELVDCSGSAGNMGCNGGEPDAAFGWIQKNGGLCLETAYAYTASQGTCNKAACASAYTIQGFTDVPANSESQLQAALARQPVSVIVDASQGWQTYAGGILDSTSGCATNLDHAVLAVGYGTDAGVDYWKVKNSWGTSWGENGYIRLKRNVGGSGTCGICMQSSYPTGATTPKVASDQPQLVFAVL